MKKTWKWMCKLSGVTKIWRRLFHSLSRELWYNQDAWEQIDRTFSQRSVSNKFAMRISRISRHVMLNPGKFPQIPIMCRSYQKSRAVVYLQPKRMIKMCAIKTGIVKIDYHHAYTCTTLLKSLTKAFAMKHVQSEIKSLYKIWRHLSCLFYCPPYWHQGSPSMSWVLLLMLI